MNSRTTQALIAFRRLSDEQIQALYETVVGYVRDLKNDGLDEQAAAGEVLVELMDALEDEGLLEPPGQDMEAEEYDPEVHGEEP